MREITSAQLSAPARVVDIDVSKDYGGESLDVSRFQSVWCLVRQDGVAMAKRFFDVRADERLSLVALRDAAAASPAVDCPHPLDMGVVDLALTLTVVICTRDRRDGLEMTLNSLARQSDPHFDVLVIDNSSDGEVAQTLKESGDLSLACSHEPAAGLSRARNHGLGLVRTDVVAWIDDDEKADPEWVASLKHGFLLQARPAAVAGVMLPAELETQAQVDFERYGGFNKGRGMLPELLVAETPSAPDPLYPLPNFGAGGNMAFRSDALRAIGGFDDCLGAGTLTHGGEETRALALILESGGTIQHWPPAVTWHYHRRSDEALERQFYGYSAGLTAFYMSMILTSPRFLKRIVGFVLPGIKRILANRRQGLPDGPPADFPTNLLAAGRRGLRDGAWMYLREVRRQRKMRARSRPDADIGRGGRR